MICLILIRFKEQGWVYMGSKEGLGSKKNGRGIQCLREPKTIGEKLGRSNAVKGIKEGG